MRSQRPQAQTIRKTGGGGWGFKEFLLCNLFWFAVCACFFFIISFLFLAYLFSAVPAASYYFTRFCLCLFVYFFMGLFCLGTSLSASFFIVPHRSGGGECVPSAILSATSSQGPRSLEARATQTHVTREGCNVIYTRHN